MQKDEERPLALVDMDGTLVDLSGPVAVELAKLSSPGEPPIETHAPGDWPEWTRARRELILRRPDFWRTLPRLRAGFVIVSILIALDFDLMILTKGPRSKPEAWGQKLEWCEENLPKSFEVAVVTKKAFAHGHLLVDDYPAYYESWLKKRRRGVVVVPAQPWNVDAEAHDPSRIYRFDSERPESLAELNRVLHAVRHRKSGDVVDVREAKAESCGQIVRPEPEFGFTPLCSLLPRANHIRICSGKSWENVLSEAGMIARTHEAVSNNPRATDLLALERWVWKMESPQAPSTS